MSIRANLVRRSRLRIAPAIFLVITSPLSYAKAGSAIMVPVDASLIRVQKSQTVLPDIIGDLFPQDPGTPGNPGTDPSCDFIECGSGTPGGPIYNPYNPGYYGQYDPRTMGRSTGVAPEFQCNLFESPPLGEILSSINALNAVVSGPACDGKVNLQNVVADNTKIAQVVKDFRQYVENPDLITPEKAGEIGNQVDIAIQSASNLAATFANTAVFSKQCRDGMDAGKIATSINSVINGLTPYALMAASMTGGTAAVPFIVGGAVLTGAINSMAQVIDQNTVNIGDELVRRAVVENTCQYIRLEQKYRFLIQDRKAQLKLINQDIRVSESMFSAKVKGMSPQANALFARRNAIDQTTREINNQLAMTQSQFQGDKIFFNAAGNVQTSCNFGVAVAQTTDDKTSYASVMLGTLGQAMAVYGKNSGVQAATLKSNSQIAIKDLKDYAAKPEHTPDETKACAETAKYFVKTIEDSASISKQLLRVAKNSVESEFQRTSDYGMLQASIGALDQKKIQAQRVTSSLDTMKTFADAVTRSEIDNSMNRIRQSLFSRSKKMFKAPVVKWFEYTEGLHQASVRNFNLGLESLGKKAVALSSGVKAAPAKTSRFNFKIPEKLTKPATSDAQKMTYFTLKTLPLESAAHRDVCRELRGVWDQYRSAVTHLGAMNAFCSLLEPYLLDSRPEDKDMVAWCRGDQSAAKSVSKVVAMKNKLINDHRKDWAVFLTRKMNELACVDPTTGQP
jgi:hypothetical protein